VFHDVITGYELSDNVLSERNGTVLIFVITTVRHQKIDTVFLIGRESPVAKIALARARPKTKKPSPQKQSATMAFDLCGVRSIPTGW
jgi:hypothetical protein